MCCTDNQPCRVVHLNCLTTTLRLLLDFKFVYSWDCGYLTYGTINADVLTDCLKCQSMVIVNPLKCSGVRWLHLKVFSATHVKRTFLISDIRALWRSGLSARVPECQKFKMLVRPGWQMSKLQGKRFVVCTFWTIYFMFNHSFLRDLLLVFHRNCVFIVYRFREITTYFCISNLSGNKWTWTQ